MNFKICIKICIRNSIKTENNPRTVIVTYRIEPSYLGRPLE